MLISGTNYTHNTALRDCNYKHKIGNVPNDFLNSYVPVKLWCNISIEFKNICATQNEVDEVYWECRNFVYNSEMDKWFSSTKAENKYLKCSQHSKLIRIYRSQY